MINNQFYSYIVPEHTQDIHVDFAQRMSFLFTGYYNYLEINEKTVPKKDSLAYNARLKDQNFARWHFKYHDKDYMIEDKYMDYLLNGPNNYDKNSKKGLDAFKYYNIKTGIELLNAHLIKYNLIYIVKPLNLLHGYIYLAFNDSPVFLKSLVDHKL
jgi:hypothetical protein